MADDIVGLENILPESISGRYQLVRKLGEGGMGNVFLAEDTQLSRKVAIKTIRPELAKNPDIRKRINRECKMHAAIQVNQNIVGLYDRVGDENNIFLIMEFVEGQNLSDILKKAKQKEITLSREVIITIILQSLEALSCIHQHDIIHRDIKPSNLIVSGLNKGTPSTKLMDFGIARPVVEDEDATQLTAVDAGGPGTPTYMSPERIDSKTFGSICPATDLYAIGVILYEMFHLEPPFHGTLTEVLAGHISRMPDFKHLDSVPENIKSVIVKSLQKKPEDRYQDAKSFSNALRLSAAAGDVDGDRTMLATPQDATMLATPQDLGSISLANGPSDPSLSQTPKTEQTKAGSDSDAGTPGKFSPKMKMASVAGLLLLVIIVIGSVSGLFKGSDKPVAPPKQESDELVSLSTEETKSPPVKEKAEVKTVTDQEKKSVSTTVEKSKPPATDPPVKEKAQAVTTKPENVSPPPVQKAKPETTKPDTETLVSKQKSDPPKTEDIAKEKEVPKVVEKPAKEEKEPVVKKAEETRIGTVLAREELKRARKKKNYNYITIPLN